MTRPNCYECEYVGSISGSAHVSCRHPSYKSITDNPLAKLLGLFASVGRVSPISVQCLEIKVKGNNMGIKNGWFNHPFSFDPVWLIDCTGYKKRKKVDEY